MGCGASTPGAAGGATAPAPPRRGPIRELHDEVVGPGGKPQKRAQGVTEGVPVAPSPAGAAHDEPTKPAAKPHGRPGALPPHWSLSAAPCALLPRATYGLVAPSSPPRPPGIASPARSVTNFLLTKKYFDATRLRSVAQAPSSSAAAAGRAAGTRGRDQSGAVLVPAVRRGCEQFYKKEFLTSF